MEHTSLSTSVWAEAWQRSWDRLQEGYVLDRELRIGAVLDVLTVTGTPEPTVLDLACGTGTIIRRLLDRYPAARSIGVDVDPVLLTIASATFADDDRVQIVQADLRDPAWIAALPVAQVDAVLTATALHWLPENVVQRLYGDLARLVRGGGVVAHLEKMPLADLPRLGAALGDLARTRRERGGGRQPDWDAWWEEVARDPRLRHAAAERRAVFETNYPTEEFSPPADWHIAALRNAAFAEAGVVWRAGSAGIVAAVR